VNKFKLALYGAFFNFTIDSSIVIWYTGFVIKKGRLNMKSNVVDEIIGKAKHLFMLATGINSDQWKDSQDDPRYKIATLYLPQGYIKLTMCDPDKCIFIDDAHIVLNIGTLSCMKAKANPSSIEEIYKALKNMYDTCITA